MCAGCCQPATLTQHMNSFIKHEFNPEAAVPDAAPHATVRLDFPCWVPAASPCVPDAPHVLPIRLASGAHGV